MAISSTTYRRNVMTEYDEIQEYVVPDWLLEILRVLLVQPGSYKITCIKLLRALSHDADVGLRLAKIIVEIVMGTFRCDDYPSLRMENKEITYTFNDDRSLHIYVSTHCRQYGED